MNASIGSGYTPRTLVQMVPSSAFSKLSQQAATMATAAAAPRTGKTPAMLARERELAMGNKQISATTRSMFEAEARARTIERQTADAQAKIADWERKYAKAAPDVKEYIEKKGLQPQVMQTPTGPVFLARADVGDLTRQFTIRQTSQMLKDQGWEKLYGHKKLKKSRNEEIWVQRDANGNPVTWATWDELSNKASRAQARAPFIQAAELRQAAVEASSPIGDEIVYGMSGYETLGYLDEQAPQEIRAVKAMEQNTLPANYVRVKPWWQKVLPLVGAGLVAWLVIEKLGRKRKT